MAQQLPNQSVTVNTAVAPSNGKFFSIEFTTEKESGVTKHKFAIDYSVKKVTVVLLGVAIFLGNYSTPIVLLLQKLLGV